jgi:uncharacterized protein
MGVLGEHLRNCVMKFSGCLEWRWLMGVALIVPALLFAQDVARPRFDEGIEAFQRGDVRVAFKVWKQLAAGGDKNAMFNVGYMYHQGLGVATNVDAAAEWYQKAAQGGHPAAANNLAVMYSTGRGYIIAQYDDLAMHWYTASSEGGNVNAKFNLAVRYPDRAKVNPLQADAVNKYRELALMGAARAHQVNYLILD